MCRAPSISFISSPCLRPVEADPPIPTARTPRQAQAVEGTRQGHTATRAGWGLNRRWTKTGRRAASPSTVPWTPPGPGPESSPTLRNVCGLQPASTSVHAPAGTPMPTCPGPCVRAGPVAASLTEALPCRQL